MTRYHFVSRWRIRATPEEIFSIISQPLEYPRWWPSVYLHARQVAAGGPYDLLTRGWLPYHLRWTARISEVHPPNRITALASGDFEGRGIWSIVADGIFTDITFDWKVVATKRLLRYLSPLLRPLFEANHRWAMQQGEKSLSLEVQRARAWSVAEMNAVEAAPGPASLVSPFWRT